MSITQKHSLLMQQVVITPTIKRRYSLQHWQIHIIIDYIHNKYIIKEIYTVLEPIIQSEVSQKEKHQNSILTHIYGI